MHYLQIRKFYFQSCCIASALYVVGENRRVTTHGVCRRFMTQSLHLFSLKQFFEKEDKILIDFRFSSIMELAEGFIRIT